jgi:integrase
MARTAQGWTLHRDPRTGIYTVRFRIAGRRHHRSTGTGDRREAQKRATRIYEAALRGGAAPSSVAPLYGVDLPTLLGAWLRAMERERRPATIECWQMYGLAHFVPFFGADASRIADERELARYVEHRLGKVTRSTVAKECSALQKLLSWCARPGVGYLSPEQAPKVPRPARDVKGTSSKPKTRVDLTDAQVEALIEALPVDIRAAEEGGPRRPCRAFFRVMWETGLRLGTLLRLEAPQDYHRGSNELLIREEADKAGYARAVPLSARAREALDAACPARGPIFEEADMRAQLRAAAKKAGIPPHLVRKVSNHDFRHARTTGLLDAGAPLTGVAYLLGHKRITTTDGYAHARKKAAEVALVTVDSGHQTGHRARSGAPETPKPAEGRAPRTSRFPGTCGREDSNLHGGEPARSLVQRLTLLRGENKGFPASAEATERHEFAVSGHGVPLAEAALRALEARGSEHFEARVLDLLDLVAEVLEATAADPAAEEKTG